MILEFFVIILVVGFFANDIIDITYGAFNGSEPNIIITKNTDGTTSKSGNLFGDELWYPDKAVTGVIRIDNQYKRMKITNLGVNVTQIQANLDYDLDTIRNSFLNNMKLTIKKGRLLSFDKTIVDNKSLGELLYKSDDDSLNGFILDEEDRFTISKNDFIDLEYTLYMDKDAGEELEAISADVPFYINVNEVPVTNDDDDDDNDNNNHNHKEVITEPLEVIPAIPAHWAHDCIIALLDNKKIQGYPHEKMTIEDYRNGTVKPEVYVLEAVKPNEFITRAEAAMLVGKALGLEEKNDASTGYVDSIPKWAKGYIAATTEADVFTGYPFKLFKPNNYISREEMIAVLARAFELKLENEGIELTFEDKEKIAKWAENYVKAGYHYNVITGYPDNTYKPKNNITRAEVFTIICKLLGYHDQHNVNLE